jgi:hypothetical protein
MRPPVPPRPSQRELRAAYDAGAERAREDAQALEGQPVPRADTIRAVAATLYPNRPELASSWADGYAVQAGELSR